MTGLIGFRAARQDYIFLRQEPQPLGEVPFYVILWYARSVVFCQGFQRINIEGAFYD